MGGLPAPARAVDYIRCHASQADRGAGLPVFDPPRNGYDLYQAAISGTVQGLGIIGERCRGRSAQPSICGELAF